VAFDEALASRVRDELKSLRGVDERRMFGGLIFMVNGNMAAGIHKADLIVRVGPSASAAALERPGTRVFDITGRPMKAWVLVDAKAVAGKTELRDWVRQGVDFARSLPEK
jgi:TfoX/Sxy family transcriptional regulator of competence genes